MSILLKLTGADDAQASFRRKGARAPREFVNAMKRIGTAKARALRSKIKSRLGLLAKSVGNKTKETKNGRIVDVAGPRRGFRVTLQSTGLKMRKVQGFGPAVGLVRDKDGNFLNEAVGQRTKDGKTIKLSYAAKARVFATRTRGKNKGKNVAVDPVRYAHLANKGHQRGKGRSAARGQRAFEAADQATRGPARQEIAQALLTIARA